LVSSRFFEVKTPLHASGFMMWLRCISHVVGPHVRDTWCGTAPHDIDACGFDVVAPNQVRTGGRATADP
jgi:hypothetical protein